MNFTASLVLPSIKPPKCPAMVGRIWDIFKKSWLLHWDLVFQLPKVVWGAAQGYWIILNPAWMLALLGRRQCKLMRLSRHYQMQELSKELAYWLKLKYCLGNDLMIWLGISLHAWVLFCPAKLIKKPQSSFSYLCFEDKLFKPFPYFYKKKCSYMWKLLLMEIFCGTCLLV